MNISDPSIEDMSPCAIDAFDIPFAESEAEDESVVPAFPGIVRDPRDADPRRQGVSRGFKRGRGVGTAAATGVVLRDGVPTPGSAKRFKVMDELEAEYIDKEITLRDARYRYAGEQLKHVFISPRRLSLEALELRGRLEDVEKGDGEGKRSVLEQEEEWNHAGFRAYEQDIYLHRRSLEVAYHPVRCLYNQPEITLDMRTVLVDWLSKLCRHFRLAQGTLFLAVNIMDRFLDSTPISRDCFQLLGITTFLIAAKQEEVNPPDIVELVKLCCHAYHRDQVKQLEVIILNRLQFGLLAPTMHFFFEYYCSSRMQMAPRHGYSIESLRQTRAFGRYIVEQCLQDYEACQFQPSLLALAALEVSDRLLGHCTRPKTKYCGGHTPDAIDACCLQVRSVVRRQMAGQDLQSICERYRSKGYNR